MRTDEDRAREVLERVEAERDELEKRVEKMRETIRDLCHKLKEVGRHGAMIDRETAIAVGLVVNTICTEYDL